MAERFLHGQPNYTSWDVAPDDQRFIMGREVTTNDDDEDAPDFGDVPFANALGITARPRQHDKDGGPELIVDDSVPGVDGVAVGGRDTTTADVTAALGDGETCLHSTGKGFLSRVFCKKQAVAIVVGSGVGMNISAKQKKIQMFAPEMMLELNWGSKEIGIFAGGTGLQIGNGIVRVLGGDLVFGAGNPPLKVMLGPTTGSPGGGAAAPLVAASGVSPG